MVNVRVFKRGHESIQIWTIRYEVQVEFRELPSVVVLQSTSCTTAMKQLSEIKEFLGMPLSASDLRYIDESSSRFDRR